MRGIIKKLGLGYEKIDACPNDCVFYWKDNVDIDNCPNCGESRWKSSDDGGIMTLVSGEKVPKMIFRYFRLIDRLKRLYMSSKTAPLMTWHKEERNDDVQMRNIADSALWKDFDVMYPSFASDPRNVRLGLTSDGFNPYGMMSTQYSIWPVVLIIYNLPPWLCMKQPYFILSSLIPGPKGPGNDIDVYLEPLIDELKELWEVGVETYDASKNETFKLRAALLTTINDFPAYGNLSGHKTKGKHACPHCHLDTCGLYLHKSKKVCYMRHQHFLYQNHSFRRNRRAFNGKSEMDPPPSSLSGTQVFTEMKDLRVKFGKDSETRKHNTRELKGDQKPWKKMSSSFKLQYWEHVPLCHSLDVMHVEKNASESLIGTLLRIEGKSKDTLQSRRDLELMGIRPELHPIEDGGKIYLPPACFTLSKKEKEEMMGVLSSVKVPDGYASNIRRRFQDGKIYGLKSHDHHILMQQLFPLALRKMVNKDVSRVLIDLCRCFKEICSKEATPQDFEILRDRIALTLCHMERIFPPSFFDVMVHLVLHLVEEAKVGGLVYYRWMYPVERFLRRLKMYVGNKSRPEASIAEGYLTEECLAFCARYLSGVLTRENRSFRNNDDDEDEVYRGLSIFSKTYRAMSKREDVKPECSLIKQAHSYVLANCEEVEIFSEMLETT